MHAHKSTNRRGSTSTQDVVTRFCLINKKHAVSCVCYIMYQFIPYRVSTFLSERWRTCRIFCVALQYHQPRAAQQHSTGEMTNNWRRCGALVGSGDHNNDITNRQRATPAVFCGDANHGAHRPVVYRRTADHRTGQYGHTAAAAQHSRPVNWGVSSQTADSAAQQTGELGSE